MRANRSKAVPSKGTRLGMYCRQNCMSIPRLQILVEERSHGSHHVYLGNSHQQYDLWKTNLDAFRNLHWEFIRLCYPTVVMI
jgi:hypothetical protein